MELEVGKVLQQNYASAVGMNAIGNNNLVTKVKWKSPKLLIIHCLIGMLFEVEVTTNSEETKSQIIQRISVVVTDKRNYDKYIAEYHTWVLERTILEDKFDVFKCNFSRLVPPWKFNEYVQHYKKYMFNK